MSFITNKKLLSIIRKEIEKYNNVKEGVADKYAEKEFNIPDPTTLQNRRATVNLKPTPNQGTLIGTIKDYSYDDFENKVYINTNIFLNPKHLNDFEEEVKAVSDVTGNLFVALNDEPLTHGSIISLVNTTKFKSENPNFILWRRIHKTNMFRPAFTYLDLSKLKDKNVENEYLKNVKTKNPNFEFKL